MKPSAFLINTARRPIIRQAALEEALEKKWIAGAALDVLENERAAIAWPYWFGERIGHADIAVACVLRFTAEAHPHLFDAARYPTLAAHAARCEALPPFREIMQALAPPSVD